MINCKSPQEIRLMAQAGKIAAKTLKILERNIRPGVHTSYLNELAENFIFSQKARPAFKGYRGFPAGLCVSINNEVVHGLPSRKKVLAEGDIVSLDLGVEYQGFFSDVAATFPVGRVSALAQKLIKVTQEALQAGIAHCQLGSYLFDISAAIQNKVESNGFSVVRQLVGHGIGRQLHEDPQVPNYGEAGKGPQLEEGMTFAIEPMVNAGGYQVEVLSDGWTVVTADGSLSAHFEHTVAVTKNGPLILTKYS